MSWVAAAIAGAAVVGGVVSNNASKRAANAQKGSADAATNAQLEMFDTSQRNLSPWMNAGKVSLEQLMGMIQPQQSAAVSGIPKPTLQQAEDEHLQNHIKQFGTGYTQDSDMAIKDMGVRQIHERNMAAYDQQVAAAGGQNTASADPMSGKLLKPFGMEDFQESPAYQFNLSEGRKAIEKAAASRGTMYAPATLQDIGKYSQGVASNEFQNSYSNYNTNMKNIWDRLYAMSGSGQNAAAQTGAFGTTVGGQVGENMMGAGNAQAAGIVGGSNALTGAMSQGYNAYVMNQMLANNQQSSVGSLRQNPNYTGAGDINQNMG